jgi:hypothetical protein
MTSVGVGSGGSVGSGGVVVAGAQAARTKAAMRNVVKRKLRLFI